MPVEFLTAADRTRLMDALFDTNVTFGALSKKFKEAFLPARYTAVSYELGHVCRQLISSTEGGGLINALFVVDIMRKHDSIAAKSTFYDVLIELERAIRRDMFVVEQIKYTTKESKEGKKSLEATRAEIFRIHCAAKVFAFQLLGDAVAEDEKTISYVSKRQDTIDDALSAWEKASIKIKEPMADAEHCWVAEHEKQQCGAVYETAAVFDVQPNNTSALLMPSMTVKLPVLPVQEGELQYLLPSKTAMLLFDSAAPSESWTRAKRLTEEARKSKLSKEDEQTLLSLLSDSLVSRLGVSPQLLSDVGLRNPEVCASFLKKVPSPSAGAFIQVLLKSSIPDDSMQTILLHASSVLQQINVRTFISTMIHKLKDKPASASSDAVKNFALTLQQLLGRAAKENKEIFIADGLQSELDQLFQSTNNQEVKSRWDEMRRQ